MFRAGAAHARLQKLEKATLAAAAIANAAKTAATEATATPALAASQHDMWLNIGGPNKDIAENNPGGQQSFRRQEPHFPKVHGFRRRHPGTCARLAWPTGGLGVAEQGGVETGCNGASAALGLSGLLVAGLQQAGLLQLSEAPEEPERSRRLTALVRSELGALTYDAPGRQVLPLKLVCWISATIKISRTKVADDLRNVVMEA